MRWTDAAVSMLLVAFSLVASLCHVAAGPSDFDVLDPWQYLHKGAETRLKFFENNQTLRSYQAFAHLISDPHLYSHLTSEDRQNLIDMLKDEVIKSAIQSLSYFAPDIYIQTILTDSNSQQIPVKWETGQDLRFVAMQTCCLSSELMPFCYVHNDTSNVPCEVHVEKLLIDVEEHKRLPNPRSRPPRYMPDHLEAEYLDDYEIGPAYKYRDDSVPSIYYSFPKYVLEELKQMVRRRQAGTNYADVDAMLYELFDDDSEGGVWETMQGQDVVIIGSLVPWYEIFALEHGASHAYTIEYNEVDHHYPGITTVTPDEYWGLGEGRQKFKVGFSISSIEHDGLGRYGDPLDPQGDFRAMRQLEDILEEGGILLLAIPVGRDLVVWNCHRVYGEYRLTKLLSRWTVERILGLNPDMLQDTVIIAPQPVKEMGISYDSDAVP
ncbi:hypothetical protein GUITHDRAFT_133881 [Guillardia theta CCMP2712]|uniref:Uncharacterized protein n=1 Tax=Guillardia theta (strain CCMP2712) TaxID=905079 RepID=L1JUA5_GUITC|nr:hypothetical protein GUITHDRAFT_133881 [Guillardia theta CCMP2712]EKX52156.1 hypothetical protein GUITHDRAFT_133881 [Guillardia theta CCMP2712]|eukprot:XP_005839136.1 hypothetical protein GUITHDRAFT_133881 [Guillardia theta CCMP2712]